jgi:hypothetical protein
LQDKKNGGWVLMIGNVRNSTYAPKIIQSFLPKSEKIRSSPNSTDRDSGLAFPPVPNQIKTDISGFECSPYIWSKKALKQQQTLPRKCAGLTSNDLMENFLIVMTKKTTTTLVWIFSKSTILN